MNSKRISPCFVFRDFKVVFVLVMTAIFSGFILFNLFENKKLSEEYFSLKNKIMNHSSFADMYQMKKHSNHSVGHPYSESVNSTLLILFSEHFPEFEISDLSRDSILVRVENADFTLFINVIFVLSQIVSIEVSHVDINFIKDSDYISGNIIILKKL